MLYIGHFCFDALDKDNRQRHGYFTCTIDAGDAETAASKMAGFILEAKKTESVFREVVKVYLEDLIEIKQLPTEPVITQIQSSAGAFPDSISHTLPAVTDPGITAFGLPSNVNRQEATQNENYLYANPFIQFEEETLDKKEAYIQKFNAKLDEWEAQLAMLKSKVELADADLKSEYQKIIEELKQKQQASRETLKTLQAAGEKGWLDMKSGIERAWEDIDAAFRAAMARFK